MPTDLLLVGEEALGDAPVRTALRAVHELSVRPREAPSNRAAAWGLNAWLAGPGGPRDVWAYRPAHRALVRFLAAHPRKYDVIVVEHSLLAPIGRFLPTRSVLTLHNVASAAWRQQAELMVGRRRLLARREQAAWRRVEVRAAQDFDVLVTVSDEDAVALGIASVTVPNGVDCARFSQVVREVVPGRVLFTGHLNFPPNSDGILWLADEVWPLVRARVPAATLDLVGRAPGQRVLAAAKASGWSVYADVPSVDPFLARAAVAVVPLRFGTGTRLKALEAMAAGAPVVGTSVGLAGLGVVNECHALVRDTAEGVAAGIVDLLTDAQRAAEIAGAARRLVRDRFDWAPLAQRMVAIISGSS